MSKEKIQTGTVIDTSIQKEELIQSDQWNDMSVSELHEQLSVLNRRLDIALQCKNTNMFNQLKKGIITVQQLIIQKADDAVIF